MATQETQEIAKAGLPTLYEVEGSLALLLDTEESVPANYQNDFRAELVDPAVKTAIAKRDRVYKFIRHCQTNAEIVKEEMDRLQKRRKVFENAEDRVRDMVFNVIESLGIDPKTNKHRKLEGTFATFSLKDKPGTLVVNDPDKVPSEFRTISVTLPLSQWNKIKDDIEDSEKIERTGKLCLDNAAIKKAIESGREIEGADIQYGYSLVVR